MITKSLATLARRLKRLDAAYARLQKKRERVPIYDRLNVWPALQTEANTISGNIMHTERCIINAVLREVAQ